MNRHDKIRLPVAYSFYGGGLIHIVSARQRYAVRFRHLLERGNGWVYTKQAGHYTEDSADGYFQSFMDNKYQSGLFKNKQHALKQAFPRNNVLRLYNSNHLIVIMM